MMKHDPYKEQLDLELRLKQEREESDATYAAKRIERIVDGVGWLIVTTVILTLLGLILIK